MEKRIVLLSLALSAALASAQNPGMESLPLMPWPASVTVSSGSLAIQDGFSVSVSGDGAADPRVRLAVSGFFVRLARQTAIPIKEKLVTADATLSIVVESRVAKGPQRLADDERYSLEITAISARLSADAPLGVLRGLETLLQLARPNVSGDPGFSFPAVTIHDEPRFPWRGLSLDVSRHFIPLEGVKRTIDGLSAVKLNVLHWHLSDDQGFRIESKKFPKLQQLGSDGMYYTQSEVRDVIGYARDRGVRIVPEFDMPGHATSWLPGYPKLGVTAGPFEIVRGSGVFAHLLDPTKESTYKFLDGFVGEMAKLFPDEYFHIGGDEVDPKEWKTSASIQAFMQNHRLADEKALQTYFNQRLLKIVTKHGKRMEGWDEILQPDLPKTILVQSWRGQPSLWKGAKEGYRGILSAGYYLDLMYPASYHYSVDPMKTPPRAPKYGGEDEEENAAQTTAMPGIAADLTAEEAKLILGGEAAMWGEIATAENEDAKLWPRLAAIAERFWSPESVTDTESMYRRLYAMNRWLQWLGLTQRTNLELMRQRLTAAMPYRPLDMLSTAFEPVKGYSRHAERYSILSPFNRLVDAISPESEVARRFRRDVDLYLASGKNAAEAAALRAQLEAWLRSANEVKVYCQTNALLATDQAAVEGVAKLAQAGIDALDSLSGSKTPSSDWKARKAAEADPYVNKRVGDLLIMFSSAVDKLVNAAQ